MPSFSQTSTDRLETCHPDLVQLMLEVVKHYDCIVLEGHRGKAAQNEAFRTGRSKLEFPKGNHNQKPSLAVDVAPYKKAKPHIDWDDTDSWRAFGGFVLGIASQMGLDIRWGGDWDSDWEFKDQSFVDLPHFELRT